MTFCITMKIDGALARLRGLRHVRRVRGGRLLLRGGSRAAFSEGASIEGAIASTSDHATDAAPVNPLF